MPREGQCFVVAAFPGYIHFLCVANNYDPGQINFKSIQILVLILALRVWKHVFFFFFFFFFFFLCVCVCVCCFVRNACFNET